MVTKKQTTDSKRKPPVEHQFKPGKSGHPQGRPKGSKNRHSIIRKVLGQLVSGDLDGRKKKITVTEASLLRLSQKALNGETQAINTILALWKETEDALEAEHEAQYPFNDADRTVIDDVYARMKASEKKPA